MHLKFFVEREYSNFYDKLQVKLYKYKVDSYSFYLFYAYETVYFPGPGKIKPRSRSLFQNHLVSLTSREILCSALLTQIISFISTS